MNGKILTLVEISGTGGEEALAKDIAMHTAAAAPEFLSPEKVPARCDCEGKRNCQDTNPRQASKYRR